MPPSAPLDQLLVDELMTLLGQIGTPSSSWLTAPNLVQELPPPDALDDTKALQLFLDHYQTTNRDQEAGTFEAHGWISRFRVWIAAKIVTGDASFGRVTLRKAAADVWRVLESADGTFTTMSADEGLDFGNYQVRRDLEVAGFAVASIDVDVKRAQLNGTT